MEIQSILRLSVLLPVAAAGLAFSSTASAQKDGAIFEEIVVTAQKRAQDIMEVPVAVSAVTGEQIEEAGIKDVFDLQQNVAGLIIGQSQTATTTNFSIRGIGSTANNFGVESSVGLYVDGVYRSRQSSMINDLVDVEAVEVLRGPQGTLFGKNTPAGAIQIRTVAPSSERDAFVDVTAGDRGFVRVSAAANIPVNDNLAFRGTLFSSQRDGYVDDLNLGNDLYNDRNRFGGRLQMMYEPSDTFNLRVIADYAEIDEVCCVATSNTDGLVSRLNFMDPGSDAALLQFGGTIFTDFLYPPPVVTFLNSLVPPGSGGGVVTGVGFDDYLVAYNFAPESKNDDSGLSVEFNKDFGDAVTLTSITAYRAFNTDDLIDGDFTNVDLFARTNVADQSSISQEFRLAGEFGSGSNYVFGAYYFAQEIDQVTATIGTPLLEAYLNNLPDIADVVAGVDGVAALAGAPYQPAGTPFLPGPLSQDVITQTHDGWAVFGQVDFAFSDDWILTLGGRYTDESKDIEAAYTQNTAALVPPPDFAGIGLELCILTACDPGVPVFDPARLADPAVFATYASFFADGWGAYALPPISPRPDLDDSLSDDQFTGNVKLTWFPSDATMLYATYATGFKSGGTNTERISPAFDPIFGPETSTSIELGFKGDIGPVRIAAAIYDMAFDDFQAQTFTGTGFNLQNAGEIEVQGIEIEALWRPTDSFEAQVIYSHNEADYKSFENGTCWDAYEFHTGIPDPGLPPGLSALAPEVCDKTGNPVAYNPEDRLFVSLQQTLDLTSNSSMFFRLEFTSTSKQFTNGDLDPFTLQDDFEIVNARIGWNVDSWNSNFTLWGRNITDERYFVGSFNAPLQLRINSYPAQPASYGVTFRKNFD